MQRLNGRKVSKTGIYFFSLRTTMGPRQSDPPPNAYLTNDTDLAHNDHTITRDHNTRAEPLPATTRTRTRLHPT